MEKYEKDIASSWETKRVFCEEADRFKTKRSIQIPFFEFDTYDLTNKTSYKALLADFYNRYYKMHGENSYLSLSVFDNSIKSQIFLDDHYVLKDEMDKATRNSLVNLGVGLDYTKLFKTSDDNVVKYIDNHFSLLFNKDITYKHGMVLEDTLGLHTYNMFEAYTKDGKYYSIYNDEELFFCEDKYIALNIKPYFNDIKSIIKNSNLPISKKEYLYRCLGEYKYLEIPFKNYDYDISLTVNMVNPEYIAGISFIALNPKYMDVTPYIDSEEVSIVKRYIQNGYQKGIFSGISVKNPLTFNDVFIFISYDFDEAIHAAIPAIDSKDKEYQEEFGTAYYDIVKDDILINSDFITDMNKEEARSKIFEVFLSEGMCSVAQSFKLEEIIISQHENIGLPIPLVTVDDINYTLVDNKYYPVTYTNRKTFNYSNDMTNHNTDNIKLFFNEYFINGLRPFYSLELDSELTNIVKENINSVNDLYVNENNLLLEFLMPSLFNIIYNKNYELNFIYNNFLNNDESDNVEYNSLKLSFITDLLKNISADAIRMYVLSEEFDSSFEIAEAKAIRYEQFLESLDETYNMEFVDDNTLDVKFYKLSDTLSNYVKNKDIKSYIKELMDFYFKYMLNEKMTEAQSLIYLKLLSLVCPFISEKIFSRLFPKSYFIVYESWPFLN